MYVVDAVIWGLVAYWGYISWRLSPKRLARRSWRSNAQLHGRQHDQVGPNGMTYTASDGTQVLIPWTAIDEVRETKRSFLLIDHRGEVQNNLPKRGLSSPDLIPALREFLNRFIQGQPPATPDSAR
jgi:YcxB-like protein